MRRSLRLTLPVLVLAMLLHALHARAEDAPKADLKSEFQTLKKEIEAAEPKEDAPDKVKFEYFEKYKSRFSDFAKKHPQTIEGFQAAFTVASLMRQINDPEMPAYAELAANTAPASGGPTDAVAACWAWVMAARAQSKDIEGAKAALEKIKPLDEKGYAALSAQLDSYSKRIEAEKKAAELLKPGNPPYPIDEKDVNDKAFSLADWKGKVVIVEFWATDCPICMGEMPKMAKLYQSFHEKGLEIVGVNLDEDEAALRGAMKDNNIAWTILFPSKSKSDIAIKWGIMPIPKIYVIDRKGLIRNADVLGDDLAKAVGSLIEEKAN